MAEDLGQIVSELVIDLFPIHKPD